MRSMKEGTGFDPQNYAEAGMAKNGKEAEAEDEKEVCVLRQ